MLVDRALHQRRRPVRRHQVHGHRDHAVQTVEVLGAQRPRNHVGALGRVAGTAANAIGAFDTAAPLLATAVSGLRTRGRLGLLARALTQQAWSSAQRVDLGVGIPVAQEAEQLAGETAQPTIQFTARAIQAMLAAFRGDLAVPRRALPRPSSSASRGVLAPYWR